MERVALGRGQQDGLVLGPLAQDIAEGVVGRREEAVVQGVELVVVAGVPQLGLGRGQGVQPVGGQEVDGPLARRREAVAVGEGAGADVAAIDEHLMLANGRRQTGGDGGVERVGRRFPRLHGHQRPEEPRPTALRLDVGRERADDAPALNSDAGGPVEAQAEVAQLLTDILRRQAEVADVVLRPGVIGGDEVHQGVEAVGVAANDADHGVSPAAAR